MLRFPNNTFMLFHNDYKISCCSPGLGVWNSFQVVEDSVLDTLPTSIRVTPESSILVSSGLVCGVLFPDQQKENVHLSQEGQSRLCHCHRSIFRPSALSPPLSSLLLVFALICSRKFLLSDCLFPLISQVPTGTWKVGCAQRLERKLQQDNYGGQCPVDVISTSLLRPEVFFFLFHFSSGYSPTPPSPVSVNLCLKALWHCLAGLCVSLLSNSKSTAPSSDLETYPLIEMLSSEA